MKSFIALAAVLALTGTVQAAPTKAKARTAKTVRAKGQKVAAVQKPQVEDVSSAASDVQLTETAKLSDVKPIVQAKKWSAGMDIETYAPIKATNEGTIAQNGANDTETDYAAKIGYKIADTVTVQAVAEWYQMWGANEAEASTTMLDPSLRISKSDLADLGNGVGLSGQARLYLPTSEASQDKEQIAQIRLYAIASREITKALSASFMLNPRIFAQQNQTYINADGQERSVDQFRLLSSAGVKYAFNSVFAVEQTVGMYQKWRANTDRKDFLDASTSMYITPVSWMELNLGIRQIDEATDARVGGLRGLYSQDQAEYFLLTSFSI
ncbi:MAG: hypothetical protein V4596_07905 [Bdellovibrionota bacterium]